MYFVFEKHLVEKLPQDGSYRVEAYENLLNNCSYRVEAQGSLLVYYRADAH